MSNAIHVAKADEIVGSVFTPECSDLALKIWGHSSDRTDAIIGARNYHNSSIIDSAFLRGWQAAVSALRTHLLKDFMLQEARVKSEEAQDVPAGQRETQTDSGSSDPDPTSDESEEGEGSSPVPAPADESGGRSGD